MNTTPSVGKADDYDFTPGRTAAVKFVNRLGQHISEPGVYPVVVIVLDDGRWQIVVEPGKVEELE